jgi:hypothetical protein
MAMIDPQGMYFGDRMAKLSLMARLHWPHIFLLQNGCGRFEINYPKIVGRAYATFTPVPTSTEIGKYIREYRDSYLLFVYKSNGQVWGQWDISEKFLPRYKDAEAINSPAPSTKEFADWRERYVSSKVNDHSVSSSTCSVFENLSLNFPLGVVEGVGVVEGKEEKTFSSKAPDQQPKEKSSTRQNPSPGISRTAATNGDLRTAATDLRNAAPKSEPLSQREPRSETCSNGEPQSPGTNLELLKQSWFDQEFWPNIWRKVDKAEALKSFKKKATSEAVKDKIVNAVKLYYPVYISRSPEHRPHASTWLNKNRFDDELPEDPREAAKPLEDALSRTRTKHNDALQIARQLEAR